MTTPSLPPTPPTGPYAGPAAAPSAAPSPSEYPQPVIQPVAPARPKRGSSAGGLLLVVAAVIAVGGIAFAVGRVTAPANASTAAASGFGNGNFANGGGFANGSFAPGQNGGFARRGFGALATEATVTAVGQDSLTIRLGNGSQTIQVKTSPATTYHTQQAATASAVTVGSKVLLQFADESTGTTGPGAATTPNGSAAPAPNASGAPGPGGFFRNFGTVKDVTVLAAQ